MTIREYGKKDIEKLVKLWVKVFDDEEPFVRDFFRLLPEMGTCVVGLEDGKIVAMTSVLTGFELIDNNQKRKVGYL